MNYLFRLDVQKHNFQHRILLSTRSDADFVLEHPILRECFEQIGTGEGGAQPFEHLLTDEQVNDIWMAVKGL